MASPANNLPPVPEYIIQEALEYARNKFGVKLYEGRLRLLYDKARARRSVMKCGFTDARSWALQSLLTEHDAEAQVRYKAYQAAIGKIGSLYRLRINAVPSTPKALSPTERIRQHVTLGRDNRQYEFILS